MVLYCNNSFSIEAKKIGVVSQTTLDQETLSDVVRALIDEGGRTKGLQHHLRKHTHQEA